MTAPRSFLVLVAVGIASCGANSPDATDADSADRTDTASGDGRDADSTGEDVSGSDGLQIEPCPEAEGDCGWRCCAGRSSEWDPYSWCWNIEGPTDTWLHVYDAERIVADSVGVVVPPLDAWTWRADGSELAVHSSFASCRWWLECQNWCWQIGVMVFVIDVSSGRQLHVEYVRNYVPLYGGNPGGLWPYLLGHERPPRCPPDVYGGDCTWFEIPERGIAYVLRYSAFNLSYALERLAELPVIRDVIPIYDLATHEQVGAVDLVVPDKVCGPQDPECP